MTQTPAASAIAPAGATTPGGAGRLPAGALVLVADIGGTNTRLALARDGALLTDTIRRFANADHARPEAVFHAYLGALKAEGKLERHAPGGQPGTRGTRGIRAVVVAIAGVIEAGVARMTNLGWELSEAGLTALTGAEYCLIINDLQAQGHALAHLKPAALETLWPGEGAAPGATRLVVGLGTGFNACPVHRLAQGGGQVFIPASETGQADLALLPARAGRDTADLAAFLADGRPGPRIEDLLCGPGLARAYRYFSATGAASAVSPAQVTAAAADDSAAQAALELFVQALGRVVADLALIHLPLGGIYLIGGVARAVAPHFRRFGFETAFRHRGRFSPVMARFPMHLVADDYAALTGCAWALRQ